jgi:hypothetical protein
MGTSAALEREALALGYTLAPGAQAGPAPRAGPARAR